jgi:hypothetical protein
MGSNIIKQRMKDNNLLKYGVENVSEADEIKTKIRETKKRKIRR